MNGKKVISLIAAVAISFPVTAYAKGTGKPAQNQDKGNQTVQTVKGNEAAKPANAQKQEAAQKKDEKKQQIAAFKTEMRAKHEQMKEIRQDTIALRQKVEQKRAQLAAVISDIQSGKKTLTEDMLSSLLSLSQNLLTDVDKVKETAEISDEVADTQSKVDKADFNNALNSMDKVIAKLQARLDALKQLSADLDKALAIANLAAAPAPATAPAGSQDAGTAQQVPTATP